MSDLELRSAVVMASPLTKAKPKVAAAGQLLTVGQVAFKLQLHESTIIRLISTGSIAALCVRSGKRKKTYRVRSEVLDKWILSKERESTGA
jgi:excisionase family DNA binding protein